MTQPPPGPLSIPEPEWDGHQVASLAGLPSASAGVRRRRLFEWSGTSAPVAVLLVSGVALGPRGINLLSADALSALASVIPVALAAFGVLVGLSVSVGKPGERVAARAGIDALLTLLIVSTGIGGLAFAGSPVPVTSAVLLIAGAGICAASSLTLPTGNPLEPRAATTRLVELGVLVPISVGGLLLAWVRAGSPTGTLTLLVAASGVICIVATAAWLLLTVAPSETEKRVLTMAALLLVGGVSDALSTSALFAGVVAGLFWRYLGGKPLETIGRDVVLVQHPVLVVVLLTAGADASFTRASFTFGAAYLVLRVVGRLAGGHVMKRLPGAAMPGHLGLQLLSPGVFGAAFALDAVGAAGADASVLLGAVVLGTIGSELVAFRLAPDRIGR
jgi:hypothetical protein